MGTESVMFTAERNKKITTADEGGKGISWGINNTSRYVYNNCRTEHKPRIYKETEDLKSGYAEPNLIRKRSSVRQ